MTYSYETERDESRNGKESQLPDPLRRELAERRMIADIIDEIPALPKNETLLSRCHVMLRQRRLRHLRTYSYAVAACAAFVCLVLFISTRTGTNQPGKEIPYSVQKADPDRGNGVLPEPDTVRSGGLRPPPPVVATVPARTFQVFDTPKPRVITINELDDEEMMRMSSGKLAMILIGAPGKNQRVLVLDRKTGRSVN